MSASMINFESAREKEQQRQLEREARQAILEKAEQEYEARQQQQEAARQRGEHTWMLPSVEAKLTRDSDTGGKKKKKKDKKKKKKKDKKAKKSKRKDSSSSNSDNEGADDKVGEDVWVESTSSAPPSKGPVPPPAPRAAVQSQLQESSTGGGVKRDGWMEMTSLFGTFSRDEMREREGTSRKKAKEEEEKRKKEAAKPGSHARELNPYYKNGGMGLPEEQPGSSSSSSTAAVATAPQTTGLDAGWLHRALQRAKEQAEAEGMTLEEVAAQRWGSLARFNELLAEAEGRGQQKGNDERNQKWRRERKRNRSRSREKARMRNRSREKDRMKNRSRSREKDRMRNRSSSREKDRMRNRSRSREKDRMRNRSRSREKDRMRNRSSSREKDRMKNRSRSREKDRMRNRSRSREDRSRSREKDRMGNRSRETGKRSISRDRDRNRSRSTSQGRGSIRRSSRSRDRDRSRSRSRQRERSRRDWRGRSRSRERRDKSEEQRRRHGSQSSSSSSSSSRDSSSSNKNRSSKQGDQKDERENNTRPSDKSSKASGSSLRFQKPGDDDSTARFASWPSTSSNRSRNRWQKEHRQSTKEQQLNRNPRPPASSSSSSSSEDEAATTTTGATTAAAGEQSEAPTIAAVTTQPSALTQPIPLTDKEMNELAAKIVKAELVGNETLMVKLKARLEAARAVQAAAEGQAAKAGQETVRQTEEQVVVLTRTDSKGVSRPVAGEAGAEAGSRMRRTKVKTHGKDGQRVKYFPDDDQHSLKNMFEREKGTTADDQNAMFEDAAMKNVERLDDDYDIDDLFMSKAALRDSAAKQAERDRKKAMQEHQRVERSLESCRRCFDNKEMPKHLIVALGTKCYLSLPAHQSLTPGHCCIVPIHHITCCLQADEDLWEEIQSFRKSLVKMFSSRGEDCIFFETAKRLQHFPHMVLQCVPLPRETGDLAPIYFKKAIMECEHEWAQNKKLVELKGRDVRRAVPKGLPYFFVDFAMDPGFAHVIEDEQTFPNHFAQEIVGGMMELDNNLWRKPLRENFEIQRRKVMEFSRWYKEFDPTQNN